MARRGGAAQPNHRGSGYAGAARLSPLRAIETGGHVLIEHQLGPQRVGPWWRVAVVIDAQTTAKIDVVDRDACGLRTRQQLLQPRRYPMDVDGNGHGDTG